MWGLYINIQQPTKTCPGINPIVLGFRWSDFCLEQQQNEQSSVRFIYKLPTIHQDRPMINPMGIGAPWANAYL